MFNNKNMKLSISGNTEYYQNPQKGDNEIRIIEETFYIEGSSTLNYEKSFLTIGIKGEKYSVSVDNILNISQELKGCQEVGAVLVKYKIGNNSYWKNIIQTAQDIDMIKSIFILGSIFSMYFIDYYIENNEYEKIEIEEDLYNRVILELGYEKTVVSDIYILKKEYCNKEYYKQIRHLYKINFLNKINITFNNIDISAYFMPLTKPILNINTFMSDEKTDTRDLLKTILKDRRDILINL